MVIFIFIVNQILACFLVDTDLTKNWGINGHGVQGLPPSASPVIRATQNFTVKSYLMILIWF